MEVIKTFILISLQLVIQKPWPASCKPDKIINTLHKQPDWNFWLSWKASRKTLYEGNSLNDLLQICPSGCTPSCQFPAKNPTRMEPCEPSDIEALEVAQELAKEWKEYIHLTPLTVAIRCIPPFIIIVLIIVLIILKHYRVKDLWYIPPERQWEEESDPTWGLRGNVYKLRSTRVVKSKNQDQPESDRKYFSYTENPIEFQNKFWYYKQSLRDMYKKQRHYKRNRYFHKLAWQYNKQQKVIPETLRRTKKRCRKTAEVEEIDSSSDDVQDIGQFPPMEVSVISEVQSHMLEEVKKKLKFEVSTAMAAGQFQKGRLVTQHRHKGPTTHLTKSEIEVTARGMDIDATPDFVNVDGESRRLVHLHPHQHHHHHDETGTHPHHAHFEEPGKFPPNFTRN